MANASKNVEHSVSRVSVRQKKQRKGTRRSGGCGSHMLSLSTSQTRVNDLPDESLRRALALLHFPPDALTVSATAAATRKPSKDCCCRRTTKKEEGRRRETEQREGQGERGNESGDKRRKRGEK